MVKYNNFKSGFSFAEALISMLVISVFFLATSKVMTQRQPDDVIWHSHGFCACYYSGGLKLECSLNDSKPKEKTITTGACKINLPRNATMYNIALIRGGWVYENEEFINEDVRFTPGGTIEIDGNDITQRFLEQAEEHKLKYSDYKELLLNFEPKATFINKTTQAVYMNW